MLRMSAFQGWRCFKSNVLSFPQYLSICSEVENYQNRFKKPKICLLFMMLNWKKEHILVRFSKMIMMGKTYFALFFFHIGEKHVKEKNLNIYDIRSVCVWLCHKNLRPGPRFQPKTGASAFAGNISHIIIPSKKRPSIYNRRIVCLFVCTSQDSQNRPEGTL